MCKTISSQYKIVKLESKSEVELQLKSTRMSLVKSLCCVEGKSGLRLRVQVKGKSVFVRYRFMPLIRRRIFKSQVDPLC